jgi:hypothetical protein
MAWPAWEVATVPWPAWEAATVLWPAWEAATVLWPAWEVAVPWPAPVDCEVVTPVVLYARVGHEVMMVVACAHVESELVAVQCVHVDNEVMTAELCARVE